MVEIIVKTFSNARDLERWLNTSVQLVSIIQITHAMVKAGTELIHCYTLIYESRC